MPTDSNGNYSLPDGYRAIQGETIEPNQHNPPLEDLRDAMTARLPRSGVAPMSGPLLVVPGTVGAPGVGFSAFPTWGFYKTATGIGLAIAGTRVFEVGPTGIVFGNPVAAADMPGIGALASSAEAVAGVVTHHINVSGGSGTFTDGETVTATGGGSGVYVAGSSTSGVFAVRAGTGAFTGTLTGSTSAATRDISAYGPLLITPVSLTAALAASALRGYINGCEGSNNASDLTNDIDISLGVCRDSTNAKNIVCAAMTKKLDANWVAGTNQGFRNSAAGITDTTYWVYAVAKADGTQDYYAHTSTTVATVLAALQAESGGADYIYARVIFPIVRASGAIIQFFQDADEFQFKTPRLDQSNAAVTSVSQLLTLPSIPNGRRIKARVQVHMLVSASGTPLTTFSDPAVDDTPPGAEVNQVSGNTVGMTAGGLSNVRAMHVIDVWTNTSRQIRACSYTSTTAVGISSLGFMYLRAKY